MILIIIAFLLLPLAINQSIKLFESIDIDGWLVTEERIQRALREERNARR